MCLTTISYNLILLVFILRGTISQDYDVEDIQCSFSSQGSTVGDIMTARLKRPVGFKGSPIFADDRFMLENDRSCSMKKDPTDIDELTYNLKVTDFNKCGVLKRNGFVQVRIWFPQFPGVVMQSDQELIIMCKPPEPTVIQNKAAGFAGSFPHGARVSGVVEETPGRLEYEVALYKEAPPVARITGTNLGGITTKEPVGNTNELPVDQAVPIGTKLQLRARINQQSAWKYLKLIEVTVSPDPDNPHANGAVSLVSSGCRNKDFGTIIPHQPAKYRDRPNEVFLDFEAFLLISMKERATLWIHSQIKACMNSGDCSPEYCNDYEPSGHGRRRRNALSTFSQNEPNNIYHTNFTRFKGNLEYAVIMPSEELEFGQPMANQCHNIFTITAIFAFLLTICIGFNFILIVRLKMFKDNRETFRYATGYTGRPIGQ